VGTVLAASGCALAIPFTPVAPHLGFVPPPPGLVATICLLALAYLVLAELCKRAFYRRASV
jgi:Mg2+-importing ATPase